MELMAVLNNSVDMLVHFFIKELEHSWRVKFADCKEFVYKDGVDQIKVIIDMKGTKQKDITNKQMLAVYKQLVLEVQRFFPCLVHKIYVLRRILDPMGTTDAIEFLIDKLSQTKTNDDFYDSMNT